MPLTQEQIDTLTIKLRGDDDTPVHSVGGYNSGVVAQCLFYTTS